jgi:integrase/recombinase XerD
MSIVLSVERSSAPSGEVLVRLGHELLDDYLTFLAGRARPNSVLAGAFDLKVFVTWAQKETDEITIRDVGCHLTLSRSIRRNRSP